MVLDKLDKRSEAAVLCGGVRELEFTIRLVPVSVTVTDAPPIAAFCESVTVPEIFPRVSCAIAIPEIRKNPKLMANYRMTTSCFNVGLIYISNNTGLTSSLIREAHPQ